MTSRSPVAGTPRTLRDFEPLLPAEAALLRAWASGTIAKVGYRRPIGASREVQLRAEFLAFVARGGGGEVPFESPTLQVLGAWVSGRLNLIEATIPMSLWLYRCGFEATPLLDGARVAGSLSFPGCALPGFRAQGATIDGTLALNSGCILLGAVRLERATLGGDLDFERSQLCTGESAVVVARPLVADGAHIAGHVRISGGFRAEGEVRFVGARIAGDFRAGHSGLTAGVDNDGVRDTALNLDHAHVGGSVFLDAGFSAGGQVRLRGARIDGDLDCTEAAFDVLGDAAWNDGSAVMMDRARIGGALILQQLQAPLQGGSLADASAGELADDAATWGQRHVLDGFAYRRLGPGAPTDAPTRLRWLERQQATHLDDDLRPQPWRQLIAVLRSGGHGASAGAVAIGREKHLRRIGRIGNAAPAAWRWLVRLGHGLFGLLAGYGQRPLRLLGSMAALWLVCGGLYWAAAEQGLMGPASTAVYNDPRLASCRTATASAASRWTACPELHPGHPGFSPFVYSLESLLPALDLRQQRHWEPLVGLASDDAGWGMATLMLTWIEATLGWLAGIMLIVSLAGLADRDRHS